MPMVNEEVALPGATLSTYRSGQGAPLLHGGPGGEFAPLARVASMIDDVAEVLLHASGAAELDLVASPVPAAVGLPA